MQNANMGTITRTDTPRGDALPTSLRGATQEFESLFIAQIMKAMRSTVPESGMMGKGDGQKIFSEMLDQELSRQVSFSGGFGVGDILYRQLSQGQPEPSAQPSQESHNHENR